MIFPPNWWAPQECFYGSEKATRYFISPIWDDFARWVCEQHLNVAQQDHDSKVHAMKSQHANPQNP